MGNTCFMSTAVQCLSAVQPLSDFFIGDLHQFTLNKTNPMGSGGNVTNKFATLIKHLWSGKEQKVYPLEFLKTLGQYASHLVSGAQQDAQEFLAYLLDVLHEDLNRADKQQILQKKRDASLKNSNDGPSDNVQQQLTEEQQEIIAYESWKEHLFQNRSIIVDLFQGQLKSTLTCLNCNYISIKFDTFMYLSVPIPKNMFTKPNLEQCVQEFTQEEILDNEDKWKCPRCRINVKAKKKIDIWKLPSILIVHLKRFEFSEQKKGKIKDYVDFPLKNLDLTPYVSKLQRDKPIYDLFAVCNHEGFLGGGHYYSYTKHRHNQQWYQFNDELVSLIKKESEIVSSDAYILFYSKMSVNEFCRQTLSEPGLWPHIVTNVKQITETVVTSVQPTNISKTITSRIDVSQNIQQVPLSKPPAHSALNKYGTGSISKIIGMQQERDFQQDYHKQPVQNNGDREGFNERQLTTNNSAKFSLLDHQMTPLKGGSSFYDGDYFDKSRLNQPSAQTDYFNTSPDIARPSLYNRVSRNYNSSAAPQKIIGQMIAQGNFNPNYTLKASSLVNSQGSPSPPISELQQQFNTIQQYPSQQYSKNVTGKTAPYVINNNSNNYYINLYMRNRDNNYD